jgi:uncharacterized protein (TIGR00730 family)
MRLHLGDIMKRKDFRVAIFGSARIKKNDPRYRQVYVLSKAIAKDNIDVVTGGGPGLMDAASRGHHAGKGKNKVHSVGLTIKLPFESKRGYHLDIHKNFDKFSHRLDTFMNLSDVVVVAPGGIGTMLEFFYTWQLLQVKHICDNIPIILLGRMWKGLISWVKKDPLRKKLLSPGDLDNIFLVNSCKDAIKIIRKSKELYDKGGKVCVNLKKYKL